MQNLEWYLTDLKSTGKNTIETVEKSLTDMFIRLVRIYPCLYITARANTYSIIKFLINKHYHCYDIVRSRCFLIKSDFLKYSVKNYFQNIKAELCVYRPTGIHIYKT